MLRVLLAVGTAVLLCAGTGYTVHVNDGRTAAQRTVTDYNDGFTDGVCAGSHTSATGPYGIHCK